MDAEVRSFLGVPLIFQNVVLGVLAVGSNATENFGEEDLNFMQRCAGLVTRVMILSYKGLQWEVDQEVYRLHTDLEKSLIGVQDEDQAILCFVQHIRSLLSFDRFTYCLRKGEEGIIRYVYGQMDNMGQGVSFPLDDGLAGWVLKRNVPLVLTNMMDGDYARPRYFQNEDKKHGLVSYLGIPLGSTELAWGSLILESKSVNQYGEKSKNVMLTLAVCLQIVLERIRLNHQLHELEGDRP